MEEKEIQMPENTLEDHRELWYRSIDENNALKEEPGIYKQLCRVQSEVIGRQTKL